MGNKGRQDIEWFIRAVTCSHLWAGSWRATAFCSQWFCGICVARLTLWWLNLLLFLFLQARCEVSWDSTQVQAQESRVTH